MLILLPPSESKANRRRGRPADAVDVVRSPRSAPTRASASPRPSSRPAAPPTPRPCSGCPRACSTRWPATSCSTTAPATPAAEVYTGVLYDALDLATARHRPPAAARTGGSSSCPRSTAPCAPVTGSRPTGCPWARRCPGSARWPRCGAPPSTRCCPDVAGRGRRRRLPVGGVCRRVASRAPTSPPAGCRCACPGPATWPSTPAASSPGTCARRGSPRGRCRRCADVVAGAFDDRPARAGATRGSVGARRRRCVTG